MEVAERCQTLLFGAYRLDQYSDPKSFMLQVAAVFSQYDNAVLLFATDPLRRDCIQLSHKFPPSLAEIRDVLDSAKKTLDAIAFVEDRESRGFKFDGRSFRNAAGEKYDPVKHRKLPQMTLPIARAD